MASLQARHQRSCALYPWTPFKKATKAAGCTCEHPGPLYHVTHRVAGKLKREPVGHNRKEAERELKAFEGDVARGRSRILKEITFDAWAEEWLAGFTGKTNSRRVYEDTIAYASATFGAVKVRDLDSSDVRRFLEKIREENERRLRRVNGRRAERGEPPREVSPATLAKHLRQLGACLEAARTERYAEGNAVRELHKSARPRVPKSPPTYYTDHELARLWPELAERPVYAALCKAAVLTGCRFGELAALTWADLNLLGRELHVERTYTAGIGLVPLPKSNEVRTVDLTPQAAALFEVWLVEAGGEGLVFEREDGGYLSNAYALRSVLYPALERAGIPRVGERGRERGFHSFRHTFARIALEHGAEITWVKEQLGHSSIQLTVDLYGRWARSAEKAQAERLGAAFPV
jgi:integrase